MMTTIMHAVACASCGRWTREASNGQCGPCASGGWLPSERLLKAETPNEKPCVRCGEVKPLKAFEEAIHNRDGFRGYCRMCMKAERQRRKR